MLLGDIISNLQDEAFAYEALVGLADLSLLVRVRQAAMEADLGLGEYASSAVMLFADQASDEDWVSLIGTMGQADDPGQMCLKRMLEHALRPQSHPAGCGHHHHA